MPRASVIGAGPNGLAAAITMAQAGYGVEVFEAETTIGGASRTLPLTLPGYRHDFGSAIHPMAAASPFFQQLPLADHGLRWIHGLSALAHPLDDGTAVLLEQNLDEAVRGLGEDGPAWRRMTGALAQNWAVFADEIFRPLLHVPRHPLLMAGFGMHAVLPATVLARHLFRSERTRALFAGFAAHSFLSLDAPLSSAIGIVLAATTHVVGWPVPEGGAQAIPDALAGYLRTLGGSIATGHRVASLEELSGTHPILCDTTPSRLASLARERLPGVFRRRLERFRPGPGAFKIDYALSEPIPWTAPECRRAICLHLGGSMADIARSEDAMSKGRISERPYMILAQPTLFDPSRAPEGRHTAWVYCHVPNGCTVDMTEIIERQIERFAPGFRDCVLARRVSSPADLEAADANLTGGDISGGAMSPAQTVLRPTWQQYATPDPDLYLCSSSTPPGGGVHGMCGFRAAELALRRQKSRS